MFRVIEIHQLTKKSGTNLWLALSWANNDPKEGHRLSLKVYDSTIFKQLIVVIKSTKSNILQKKFKTYPKSTDPKITPKWTLIYPMRHIAQIFPDVTTDIPSHHLTKKSGTNLRSASSLAMADPNSALLVHSSTIIRRSIEIMWSIRKDLTKNIRTYPKSSDPIVT